MSWYSEMCEIIPGLLLGSVNDAEKMVLKGADVLVPLAYLDGSIWKTTFRGEVIYCPVEDMKVLPDDVLDELVIRICARLDEGKKVGLFCAGGHGRTGYVAGCVLARKGIKDPIGFLRRNYSAKAIETEQQANAVFAYARGLRAQEVNSGGLGENFFEYNSYYGTRPFVYLSFSEWDHDAAAETVRILNELGFYVVYDRSVLQGRLWSTDRSNAIEDCSVFVTINSPCEHNSHIREAECSFAEMLEKPVITIETDRDDWKYYADESSHIASDPAEPDFGDKCLKALEQKGLVPAPDRPDPARDKPVRFVFGVVDRSERRWDLGLVYHEHYGDGGRQFRNDRRCNLRTRETFDSFKNKLEDPSDEELYRAIGWKCVDFGLFRRSSSRDYYMSEADREFTRRLCTLGGKPVPEIKAQYDREKKEIEDFWRDYPYMDEFEYVDSRFDD